MLRDIFKRKAPVIHAQLTALVELKAGDTLAVMLPPDWTPKMMQQYADFVQTAWASQLPEGVGLIFITSAHAPVVIRGSVSEPNCKKDGENGDQ